jgi:hypothetical protein
MVQRGRLLKQIAVDVAAVQLGVGSAAFSFRNVDPIVCGPWDARQGCGPAARGGVVLKHRGRWSREIGGSEHLWSSELIGQTWCCVETLIGSYF